MTNRYLLSTAAVLALWSGSSIEAHAQQTTASVRGQVLDAAGVPVPEASVILRHLPSNTTVVATSDPNGAFFARGLRLGGPYQATATVSSGDTVTVDDVFLNIGGDNTPIDLRLGTTTSLDEIVVTGTRTVPSTSPRSVFNATEISRLPNLGRDPKDVVRLDPFASVTASGTLSVAGVNQRYNSLTVDGIRLNDDFGINRTGNPGRSTPFSIDVVEQIEFNAAPYDVEASNYLGGNINLVTKSGTNDFHGSAYYIYSDQDLAGDLPNGVPQIFEDNIYGATLSGPLIQDRLFLFGAYEESTLGKPNNRPGLSTDMGRVRDILRSVYDFDPGDNPASVQEEDKRILLKADANISDGQRLSLTYNFNEGTSIDPVAAGTSFLSYWSVRSRQVEAYSAQLFSDWTDRFSTEVRISYKDATDNRQNPQGIGSGGTFAQFDIRNTDVGTIFAGPLQFFQTNLQTNSYLQVKLLAEYSVDDHQIKFGYDRDALDVVNTFVVGSDGVYAFNSIADLQARNAVSFSHRNSPTGDPANGAADWGYDIDGLYIQDEWRISPELRLTGGFRYERYSQPDAPAANPNFATRNGFSNSQTLDGLDIIMPRFGLTYRPDDRTTFRGGFGLFAGGTPNVFYSNAYNNNGVVIATFSPSSSGLTPATYLTNVNGYQIPTAVTASLRSGTGEVEALDPGFELPSMWKTSIGVERRFDLTGLGLGDGWDVTADLLVLRSDRALGWRYLGLQQIGTAPDGRPRYNPVTLNQDIVMTSDGRFESESLGISLTKVFENGLSLYGAYRNTDSRDENSAIGSLHVDSWQGNVATDYNDPGLTTSAFNVEHQFTTNVTFARDFFQGLTTVASITGQYQSGFPFSYTFSNGALFGDPRGQNRSPLYVPSGPGATDDPLVTYATGFNLAAFNTFLDQAGLSGRRGEIVERNAETSSDYWRWDLRLQQDLPGLWAGHKTVAFLDLQNLGNLLNDEWGVLEAVANDFGDNRLGVVNASIVNNRYVFNSFNPAVPAKQSQGSFWKLQVGIRYQF